MNFSVVACRFGSVFNANRFFKLSYGFFIFTFNSCKTNDISQFVECVREAQNFFFVILNSVCPFFPILMLYLIMCFLASVSPWLNHINYVYKVLYSSQQQYFIYPLVLFVHYIVHLLLVCVVCSK